MEIDWLMVIAKGFFLYCCVIWGASFFALYEAIPDLKKGVEKDKTPGRFYTPEMVTFSLAIAWVLSPLILIAYPLVWLFEKKSG
jgi:hypothetical protein